VCYDTMVNTVYSYHPQNCCAVFDGMVRWSTKTFLLIIIYLLRFEKIHIIY